jgi:hypothetical protein
MIRRVNMESNESYTHFTTVEECDQFVRTLPSILGRCCGGKGVCLRRPTFYSILNNPKRFPLQPTLVSNHTKRTEDTICCVCYEESSNLTSCGHLVCTRCLPLVRPLCPYCRQTL